MREGISDPAKDAVAVVKPEDVSSALPAAAPAMNAVTRHLVDAIRTVDMIHRPANDVLPRERATAIESLWNIISCTEDPAQIGLAYREVATIVVEAVRWLQENK